jgi:hypothetical protein
MSLPFLPPVAIHHAFSAIKIRSSDARLVELIEYVDKQWIINSVFPPETWSVYRRSVRTNNDCESWHARLTRKANSANLPFYKIIELLHREAVLVERCLNSLCDDKTQRITSKVTRDINEKLERLWGDFDCGAINEDELLRSCSRLYTPPIAPVLTDYTDQ